MDGVWALRDHELSQLKVWIDLSYTDRSTRAERNTNGRVLTHNCVPRI